MINRHIRLGLALLMLAFGALGCPPGHNVPDGGDRIAPDGHEGGVCPFVVIQSPTANATLGPNDDADGSCANGFQHDVVVATNADPGSTLELYVNGTRQGTATVTNSAAIFSRIEFDTAGVSQLAVRVPGNSTNCSMMHSVTVNCSDVTCRIASPTRTQLNRSDNVASMGFAVPFSIETNAENGTNVELNVSGMDAPLVASVTGGRAMFPSVRLEPDGTFTVFAQCRNRAGTTGRSATTTYRVDSVAPALTITSPAAGAVIPFSTDVNTGAAGRQFRVCATTDAGSMQNVCARVMGSTPDTPGGCAPAPAVSSEEVCVEVTCPTGSAPFNVEMTVSDEAGNETVASLMGISCASSLPSVRIVDPVAYSSSMPSTILNASRDANPARAGFQYNVIACSDAASGTAQLRVNGLDLAGASVALAPSMAGDPCATAGFPSIARFTGVTLPQSTPERHSTTDPDPTNPTLTVAVMSPAGEGVSPPVLLFVDSVAPVLTVQSPMCGTPIRPDGSGNATVDINVVSYVLPVTLTLTPTMGGTSIVRTASTYSNTIARLVTFSSVTLSTGSYDVSATATDPAGNTGSSSSCRYEVGNPPQVTFVSPTEGQVFNAATGASTTVQIRTDVPNTNVTLTINGGSGMTTMTDSTGVVTFGPLTLPEGTSVALDAVTADVPGRGVGRASVTVVVDTIPPSAPSSLTATVANRRAGTIRLTYDDASDPATPPRAVARYEIRYSTSGALDDSNFASGTAVMFTGTPGAPGTRATFDVTGLRLGQSYHVGMRAIDVGGNASPVVSQGPVTLDIQTLRITDAANRLGNSISGGYDVSGDGIPDVIVGTRNGQVRIYFGSSSGISATNYSVIGGDSGTWFGRMVASLGDFSGDGVGDIAISEPGYNSNAGRVYIFLGRSGARMWPSSSSPLSPMDADITIDVGSSADLTSARFGQAISRVGDFDGDGLADLAVGAPRANNGSTTAAGAVFVFRGRTISPGTLLTLTATDDADLTIRGETSSQLFGKRVAAGGRLVNNDMLSDLLVSANAGTFRGQVYVFSGRTLSTRTTLTLSDAVFTRSGTADNTEQSIATAVGDVNSDGRPDLAIGSGIGNGEVFLYFGNASGGLSAGGSIPNTTGSSIDDFGVVIAAVPESLLRPSLLFGSPSGADLGIGSDFTNGSDGSLALYAARPSWMGVTSSNPDARFVATRSTTMLDGLTSAEWLGDINNDGYPDMAFGQSFVSGTVYILY